MNISKEETIKRLKEARFTVQPYLYMNEAFDVAIESLSQPERPKGRWIGIPRIGVHDMCCSNCRYSSGIRFWNSPYCPNCGAEMER